MVAEEDGVVMVVAAVDSVAAEGEVSEVDTVEVVVAVSAVGVVDVEVGSEDLEGVVSMVVVEEEGTECAYIKILVYIYGVRYS